MFYKDNVLYNTERKTRIIKKGMVKDYCYLITSYGSHPCCYVSIPKRHPLFGKHYDDVSVLCHGGLTFCQRGYNCKENYLIPETEWVFGWDYAHGGDFYYTGQEEATTKVWTLKELEDEIALVIERLDLKWKKLYK